METLSYCQLMERCLRAEKTSEARKQGLIRAHKMYQREKQRAEDAEKHLSELTNTQEDSWSNLPRSFFEGKITCVRHGVEMLKHPYNILLSHPPKPAMYCPECEPDVKEWAEQENKRWMIKAP